tara:strand:- start:1969 stop:2718 length:750 start_codon:yes stop_codon:yes gene_type:complete
MTLKQKLKNGETLIGSWITFSDPSVAEVMANAGFDWLTIDLEHSSINIKQAEDLIRTIDLCGVSPLVRLTSNNSDLIKRVLDAGAKGIIVPMVKSLKDAKKAIDSAYYPPKGIRSFGLARAQRYGVGFEEYLQKSSDETIVIVQIEHIDALEELEEILSLESIDAYIIGPYDLSGSMGIPGQFDNEKYLDAIEFIRRTAERVNKPGGIHIVEPDIEAYEKAFKDYSLIAFSVDFRILDVVSRNATKKKN